MPSKPMLPINSHHSHNRNALESETKAGPLIPSGFGMQFPDGNRWTRYSAGAALHFVLGVAWFYKGRPMLQIA
jgi:hypothetical protein